MKVKLNTLERIVINGLLPTEHNFLTLKIVGDLQRQLAFSEEEKQRLELTPSPQGGLKWKPEADQAIEIEIPETAEAIIIEQLKALDSKQKLTADHLSTYEKFILSK